MDDNLLRELIAGQKEQTELLRQHLARIKFSLRTLLIVMTLLAIGFGILAYEIKPSPIPAPSAGPWTSYPPLVVPSNPGAPSSGSQPYVVVPARPYQPTPVK